MKNRAKNVLGIPVDFKCVKKIKDINVATENFKNFNLFTLVFLNIFLCATMIYYLTVFFNVLILLISLTAIISCLAWSILSYIKGKYSIKYTIYSNAIMKNYNDSKFIGVLADMRGYKVKRAAIDWFGKSRTRTIVLLFQNPICPKISLQCVNEDVDKILILINELVRQRKIEAKNEFIKSLKISKNAKKHIQNDEQKYNIKMKTKNRRLTLHSFAV